MDVATRTAIAAVVRALSKSGAIEQEVVGRIVGELHIGAADLIDRMGRRQDAETLALLAQAIENDLNEGTR